MTPEKVKQDKDYVHTCSIVMLKSVSYFVSYQLRTCIKDIAERKNKQQLKLRTIPLSPCPGNVQNVEYTTQRLSPEYI